MYVLSERGHKIVMKNDPEMKIQEENLVVLNPDDKDEAELMVLRMETRRAKAKAEKAAKKAKRKAATEGEEESGPSTSKAAKAVSNGGKGGICSCAAPDWLALLPGIKPSCRMLMMMFGRVTW